MADYDTPHYPIFLDLTGRLAVVVGGGPVAERKVRTLLRYGADVAVIAPEVTELLHELSDDQRITIEWRGYASGDLEGAFLVICATDSEEVNRAVHAEAEGRGQLVNVVDVPELCNFIVPSVVRRGPLQIAISTGGAAPAVAKRIRRWLALEYGDEWEIYVRLLGHMRPLVMERVEDSTARKAIFETIADSDLLVRITRGERPTPEEVFAEFAGEQGGPTGEGREED